MSQPVLYLVDLVAVTVLAFGLYFPRHRRRDLVVAYLGVNVGVLAVAATLATSSVGAGLGLGLFGVLSIIRLRSTELSQTEVAYYFAALALGLLGGPQPDDRQDAEQAEAETRADRARRERRRDREDADVHPEVGDHEVAPPVAGVVEGEREHGDRDEVDEVQGDLGHEAAPGPGRWAPWMGTRPFRRASLCACCARHRVRV